LQSFTHGSGNQIEIPHIVVHKHAFGKIDKIVLRIHIRKNNVRSNLKTKKRAPRKKLRKHITKALSEWYHFSGPSVIDATIYEKYCYIIDKKYNTR